MASGKTLNAANLEALGAARLAELLLEIIAGDAVAKRRLRMALAGSTGSAAAAAEVTKRLASIARSRSFLEWQKIKPLAADLDAQRRAILDLVAPTDPRGAFELLWRLVDCAESVFARSDDSNGRLASVFHDAVRDLGPLAQAAKADPADLARRAFRALCEDNYDILEDLVPTLAAQLGPVGLAMLKASMEAWQGEPVVTPPKEERRVIGWGGSGPIYDDALQVHHRRYVSAFVLKQIADVLGDVDSYIAQFDAKARMVPSIAAGIARRLLEAGRPQAALDALEAVEPGRRADFSSEWQQARIDTLEALGQGEQAQSFRMECFRTTLATDHLRAYLRKLPDFEDFEAEQLALTQALTFGDVHRALAFLVNWPDLARASQLVLTRTQELSGDLYEVLTPAAEALEDKHPLAATLLRRAMIDFALNQGRSSRYKHAARHLQDCATLAPRVEFGGLLDHTAYEKAIRAAHGRKAAFWQEQQRATR